MSAFISVHVLKKQKKIKKTSASRDSLTHWALDAALIGRMAERGEGIVTVLGG